MANEALELSQEQKQILTTSALQVAYSSMLEMNSHEIDERINREIEANPALEKVSESNDENCIDDNQNNFDNDTDNSLSDDDEQGKSEYDKEKEPNIEATNDAPDYDDYSDNDEDTYIPSSNTGNSEDFYTPIIADNNQTLADYLTAQLSEYDLTDLQKTIAETIIGNIDSNGYLTRSISAMTNDISIYLNDYVDEEEVEEMFNIIRKMEPAGICALNLGDCLRLQLERIEPSTQEIRDAISILNESYDFASVGVMKDVRTRLKFSSSRFDAAVSKIKTLNPKPGNLVGVNDVVETSQQITPDFEVSIENEETLRVTLYNDIPELQISESFSEETENLYYNSNNRADKEARKYISNYRNNANIFIRILKMRQTTLFSVMTAIVSIQKDFFLSGDERDIHPMIIKDIKDKTGYDISVISRATNSKYVQTPYGIFPLKHFFNERINNDDDTSSHEIVSVIKEIIDSEPPNHPYSDQKITDELRRRGYNVARRTVFKYRENRLKIPSSSKRKRQSK